MRASFARVRGDVLGNSYAHVGPDAGPPVLLLGHLDEIGLIVTHVEHEDADYDGLLRVRALGSWDPQVLVGQHVTIRTRTGDVPGVVGKAARHLLSESDLTRASRLEDLWVDIGAPRHRRRHLDRRRSATRSSSSGRRSSSPTGVSPPARSTTAPAPGWCSRRHAGRPRPGRCACRWSPARR